ncbi:unnamed protein product [Moneuplotes crassus]|uniref:Uncharacterized protein n=1 Tax=Euplotes crassus TaxID=5936 RepID=A0AAD1Y641_EUPCR|nr:unnamed protein product [Moneuplotes crassus]
MKDNTQALSERAQMGRQVQEIGNFSNKRRKIEEECASEGRDAILKNAEIKQKDQSKVDGNILLKNNGELEPCERKHFKITEIDETSGKRICKLPHNKHLKSKDPAEGSTEEDQDINGYLSKLQKVKESKPPKVYKFDENSTDVPSKIIYKKRQFKEKIKNDEELHSSELYQIDRIYNNGLKNSQHGLISTNESFERAKLASNSKHHDTDEQNFIKKSSEVVTKSADMNNLNQDSNTATEISLGTDTILTNEAEIMIWVPYKIVNNQETGLTIVPLHSVKVVITPMQPRDHLSTLAQLLYNKAHNSGSDSINDNQQDPQKLLNKVSSLSINTKTLDTNPHPSQSISSKHSPLLSLLIQHLTTKYCFCQTSLSP